MPGVSRVTVTSCPALNSTVSQFEKARATVERAVARQPLVEHNRNAFSQGVNIVDLAGSLDERINALNADLVVNLSGMIASTLQGSRRPVLELRWNGRQPEGLGERRAVGVPPGEIVVVCRGAKGELHVVQRSVLTCTAATPAADRRNAASRSIVLLRRALALSDTELLSDEYPLATGTPMQSALVRTADAAVASIAVGVAAIARRVSRSLWRDDAWELQYRTTPTQFVENSATVTAGGFQSYRGEYNCFFADCVALTHNGVDAVFFEEYPHALRRGVISCAVLQPGGQLGAPQRVLERPYHLSYPFVFRDGDQVYMVPESSGNHTVDLYECTEFPHRWTHRKTLLENISATDATLYYDGARWWMFATIGEEGSYSWDELHLFSADTLVSSWTPHPMNPVKCDSGSARPAGPLFRRNGRLMRPTQDCSSSYGGAVNLCEIEILSLTDFRERIVDRLDPVMFPGMNGLHTLAASDRIEVVDVRPAKRWRWENGIRGTLRSNTE